jgi:hypothetical protein
LPGDTRGDRVPDLATDADPDVVGSIVDLDGRRFYRITGYDRMPPFFMTVVGASDVWLFISSSGGLTAGRVDAERALFPYYTDDKVTENAGGTGGLTVLHVGTQGEPRQLWRPFAARRPGDPDVERSLYKDALGTTLVFEEVRPDLGLRLRVSWQTSGAFGVVRGCELTSLTDQQRRVEVLDGLRNLLPDGASVSVQDSLSNLLDAYKRTEIDAESGLGLITLSSTLTDLAEPSESLRTTVAWQVGLDAEGHLLCDRQVETFVRGGAVSSERDVRGERGAYLTHAQLTLDPGETHRWSTVADVRYDAADVVALAERLGEAGQLAQDLTDDVAATRAELRAIVAATDGLQQTGDELATMHHAANVMFNDMRGGVPADGYDVHADDFRAFLTERSPRTARRQRNVLSGLPSRLQRDGLIAQAVAAGDPDLLRLALEYLPLTFSRRHGDPSRPWNRFSIVLRDEHGNRRLDYEGNWRDIFQNWEALAWSYPEYLEGMVAVFLDATTADGYNPYRISRSGIDWEVPEPGNPWSNIGYWGDHQIVYLLRLLETAERFHPGRLDRWVNRRLFTHADVPYRIATYEQTLQDPYATITFDQAQNDTIARRVMEAGSDGRLVHDADGQLVHVTLAEKLLLLALTKLVNLVPGGGIWMNTQRPEWNDANNALAGRGLSVVTLAYLRRFLDVLAELLDIDCEVSEDLADLARGVLSVLSEHGPALAAETVDDHRRRDVMDALGSVGTAYRERVYSGPTAARETLTAAEIAELVSTARDVLDATLAASWRDDGLIHSYNVVDLSPGAAAVRRLAPMLEGQVAILAAGTLSSEQSLDVLRSLRRSALYRPDQHSYLLYPDKDLPGFLAKNTITAQQADTCPLIAELVAADERSIVRRDVRGDLHFAGQLRNARGLDEALDRLAADPAWHSAVQRDREALLTLFEEVFHHAEFTGRSGTFFAFEGLGSIYWHMVAKLLLAIQETVERAVADGASAETLQALAAAYEDVRAGLGYCKSPREYGAFPTDPYSHTPAGKGARQPGMTGQVKEEVLTRRGELGLTVEAGSIVARPTLLRAGEWGQAGEFRYRDVEGQDQRIPMPEDSFAITFCQVPVVYRRGERLAIAALLTDGTRVDGSRGDGSAASLDASLSASVFRRDGRVQSLEVRVPPAGS